jgi:hypothetical protein
LDFCRGKTVRTISASAGNFTWFELTLPGILDQPVFAGAGIVDRLDDHRQFREIQNRPAVGPQIRLDVPGPCGGPLPGIEVRAAADDSVEVLRELPGFHVCLAAAG